MSEVLLEVLSTLYHDPERAAKKKASAWLEEWRLNTEAWQVADQILHSTVTNVEVLLFCSQTLVYKIRQDFEELPQDDVLRLRESLMALLEKFSHGGGVEAVQTQIALAIVAFCAHVPASIWAPVNCIQWLAERFGKEEDDGTSISSLVALLMIFPEEKRDGYTGLHPKRREQFFKELESAFPDVVHILQVCHKVAARGEFLKALGNWTSICDQATVQSTTAAMGMFVQLAMESLKASVAVEPAVYFLSELLYVTAGAPDSREMQELTEYIATAVIEFQPLLQQPDLDDDRIPEFSRLFCEIGTNHENLILAQNDTATAIVNGILASTSHPDPDVNQHCYQFWDRFTHRVAYLIHENHFSPQRASYFIYVVEHLMAALLEQAKLPTEYAEMATEEKADICRNEIQMTMNDAVDVIGDQRCMQSLIQALETENQAGEQNWQSIEALLFALDAVAANCRRCKHEMAAALFQALGSVPESVVVKAAMCNCLSSYASWLPALVEQTGTDPLSLLLPTVFKCMMSMDWAPSAVDAFVAICKTCRSHLAAHAAELLALHRRVILAANASHLWTESEAVEFVMKESEAAEVTGALCYGISRTDDRDVAAQFIQEISEETLSGIAEAAVQSHTAPDLAEKKLVILVRRLKTIFRNCGMEPIAQQLLERVCPDLLQMADAAPMAEALTEEICSCLRYALKSSHTTCGSSAQTLALALPRLFSSNHDCGYLYVASEIAKIFGKSPEHTASVHRLVEEMFLVVNEVLCKPAAIHQLPDLADDAFLMAGRILNYCPEALLSRSELLTAVLDTASKGMLVQHEDACRSVLRFLSDLAAVKKYGDMVDPALYTRGPLLTQFLLAAVAGALPLRVLEDVAQALRSLLRRTEAQGEVWITHVIGLVPDQVLSNEEKSSFVQSLSSKALQKCERSFMKEIDALADICRRSRIVRQAAQTALLPEQSLL